MPIVKRFEELQVWQQARELDRLIFRLTLKHEISRDYRLIDQWRAASGSIMDNIAEGFDREGRKEFLQFLSIAKGSTGEVRSQAYRALDRNYLNQEEFEQVYNQALELKNRLGKFMTYLKSSEFDGVKYRTETSSSELPNRQTPKP